MLDTFQTITPADAAFRPSRFCEGCQATVGLRRTETRCSRCRLSIRLAELIGENKLSAQVWERVRRACCLPKKPGKTSSGKARAVFQMLNLFVSRVSFSEQSELSESELAERLLALPDLPPVFAKSVRRKIESDRQNNDPGDNDNSEDSRRLNEEINKENESAASPAKRKAISAACFTEVAVRQGCYCYWCGIKVIREAQIPETNRMLKNGRTILYYVGDKLREEAIGTVDHLLRVSDGGDNSLANLVISCLQCNREREKITAAYARPFACRRVPCRSCGGRFFHPDWGCCSICGAVLENMQMFSGCAKFLDTLSKLIKRIGRRFFTG